MGTGQVEVALELLASLAERIRIQDLRKVRALQWRITLSFRDGWLWLRALLAAQQTRSERHGSVPPKSVKAPTDGLFDAT
jgi:hypothetical protein